MNQSRAFYYPNRMGRVILESMEEVVGRNGLNAVFNLAGRSDLIGHYPPFDSQLEFSFATLSGLLEKLNTPMDLAAGAASPSALGASPSSTGCANLVRKWG